MKCPYCEKEMRKGYIPAVKMALQWIPENSNIPLTIFQVAKDGVRLTKNPGWTAKKAISYYCEECKMLITPVDNIV